jgi:hypothetical protein
MKGFNVLRAGIALCVFVLGIITLRTFLSSAFIVKKDRVNILIYSASPIYYSLERGGEVHYLTTFSADSRTAVPGGYGTYRIGALGKLIRLEKNPELLKKTFSRITGSMIDYYFYTAGDTIHYGSHDHVKLASLFTIFFSSSNANVFDRLYITLQFMGKHISDFEEIRIKKITEGDTILLSDNAFARQYLGYFYHKSMRRENKTVQILYSSSYNAAKNMSRVIDGEGIRVVDVDLSSELQVLSSKSACTVMENTDRGFSMTARELAGFFHCILKKGKGRVSDIVVEMGKAENEWE